jgi:L-alanine-DL-glutamate epimerase-like enolase superfamily enzyme
MKIGSLDFYNELEILKGIRAEFNENDLELRLDANGAFLHPMLWKN